MKKSILIVILATIFSCANENKSTEPTFTLLSGSIANTDATSAFISGSDFKKEMTIDPETGTFADTLFLPKSGLYQFSCGEYSTLYLKNGYDLKITIDAEKFDESISYTGIGSEVNNYLSTKFMDNEIMQGSMRDFYALEEIDFQNKVEEIKSNHLENLSKLSENDVEFVNIEKQNLKYEAFNFYNSYERIHKSVTKNPDFAVSRDFIPEELYNMTYNDSVLYASSPGYKDLAKDKILEIIFESVGDEFQIASPKELAPISEIEIPQLKNELISNYASFFISPGNPNMEANYEFMKNETTSEDIKKNLDKVYELAVKLRPGEPSPEFVNYENHKGGETSLTDLRGKYVYIDVWATWCGPCVREIPSLKKVEADYHNSNIVFVSTSIDKAKDYDTWVQMVKDKDLGGTQLMADNAWQSKFVKDYGINGIPRFILVDPDGNIVSADAPRPSDPKLVELFQELKI